MSTNRQRAARHLSADLGIPYQRALQAIIDASEVNGQKSAAGSLLVKDPPSLYPPYSAAEIFDRMHTKVRRERSAVTLISGEPGSGTSGLSYSLVAEALRAGRKVCVVDSSGALVDGVRELGERLGKRVRVLTLDSLPPGSLNPWRLSRHRNTTDWFAADLLISLIVGDVSRLGRGGETEYRAELFDAAGRLNDGSAISLAGMVSEVGSLGRLPNRYLYRELSPYISLPYADILFQASTGEPLLSAEDDVTIFHVSMPASSSRDFEEARMVTRLKEAMKDAAIRLAVRGLNSAQGAEPGMILLNAREEHLLEPSAAWKDILTIADRGISSFSQVVISTDKLPYWNSSVGNAMLSFIFRESDNDAIVSAEAWGGVKFDPSYEDIIHSLPDGSCMMNDRDKDTILVPVSITIDDDVAAMLKNLT